MRSAPFLLLLAALLGCAFHGDEPGPYSTPRELTRNTTLAEQLNRQAADLIEDDPERAERLLRQALSADIFFGPAHNNLGVVHLERGALYEAATEFEWARKLMGGHVDPTVNLALTLEKAGRAEDAVETYVSALAENPDFLPAIQGWARLSVSLDREGDELRERLEFIALRADGRWREWALGELAR